MLRRMSCLLLVAVAALGGPAGALAADETSSALAYTTTRVSASKPMPQPGPLPHENSGASCRTVTVRRDGRNLVGGTLWSYFQRVSWCYNHAWITSLERQRWAEVYYPLWRFDGHIGNSTSGGTGAWAYDAWTQGRFTACMAWCFQYSYPWVATTVRADGSYSTGEGG